jgi:hypothetical protein
VYKENFKNKKSKTKLRYEDRINQEREKEEKEFAVLIRAKLKKQRIQTILNATDIEKFHQLLLYVLALNFIPEEKLEKSKKDKNQTIKISKTKRRKMKKLKKINKIVETN